MDMARVACHITGLGVTRGTPLGCKQLALLVCETAARGYDLYPRQLVTSVLYGELTCDLCDCMMPFQRVSDTCRWEKARLPCRVPNLCRACAVKQSVKYFEGYALCV